MWADSAFDAVEAELVDDEQKFQSNSASGLRSRKQAHLMRIARSRLQHALEDAVFPPKTNPLNERLAEHLWNHIDEFFTFLHTPGIDATNWRAEQAMRFGVILRQVWGGNRTWAGAEAQAVLMSIWHTCWQRGQTALDFLSRPPPHPRHLVDITDDVDITTGPPLDGSQ